MLNWIFGSLLLNQHAQKKELKKIRKELSGQAAKERESRVMAIKILIYIMLLPITTTVYALKWMEKQQWPEDKKRNALIIIILAWIIIFFIGLITHNS